MLPSTNCTLLATMLSTVLSLGSLAGASFSRYLGDRQEINGGGQCVFRELDYRWERRGAYGAILVARVPLAALAVETHHTRAT